MDRKIYISNETLALAEYIPEIDAPNDYECWQDKAMQDGYNFKMSMTREAFCGRPIRARFIAAILRRSDRAVIGSISLSPEGSPPDLAIMLYEPFRHQGYGPLAFSLGVKYCFDELKLDRLYAGCYETNTASLSMLRRCGFQPHPEGNQQEKHYLTGEPITQLDFVILNPASEQ